MVLLALTDAWDEADKALHSHYSKHILRAIQESCEIFHP